MTKKTPVRDQKCPHCEKLFTVKGLVGHIALGHPDKKQPGETNAAKVTAPAPVAPVTQKPAVRSAFNPLDF